MGTPFAHPIPRSTQHRRLQGNCSAPLANPEGRFPPFLPQRRGQCLLTATVNLFEARHTLWIHNLYLRSNATALPTDAVVTQPFGLLAVAHAKLYVSSVTFQGEVTPQNATTVKNGLNLLALRTQAVSMGRGRAAGDGVEGPLATAPATLAVPAQVLLDGVPFLYVFFLSPSCFLSYSPPPPRAAHGHAWAPRRRRSRLPLYTRVHPSCSRRLVLRMARRAAAMCASHCVCTSWPDPVSTASQAPAVGVATGASPQPGTVLPLPRCVPASAHPPRAQIASFRRSSASRTSSSAPSTLCASRSPT